MSCFVGGWKGLACCITGLAWALGPNARDAGTRKDEAIFHMRGAPTATIGERPSFASIGDKTSSISVSTMSSPC